MSEDTSQPPYPAPAGQRWARKYWLWGPWILVADEQYPLPPAGYAVRHHPLTGRPELVRTWSDEVHAVEGISSNGSDRNIMPKPTQSPSSQLQNFGTPNQPIMATLVPVTESGRGVDGLRDDPNPDKALLALKTKARKVRELQALAYVNSD